MAIESSGEDGADIFWPGYVDAVTNLVLNLLFMLTIMIVAVFMFALELSRHKDNAPQPSAEKTASEKIVEIKLEELEAMRQKIEQLEQQQAIIPSQAQGTQRVVTVQTPLPKPEKEIKQINPRGGGIVVQFTAEAVTISPTEAETLRAKLAGIAASGGAKIEVLVPAGFSEAKRLAFYRAMAVRNQLIEMRIPAKNIQVSIREGANSADNTRVVVSPR